MPGVQRTRGDNVARLTDARGQAARLTPPTVMRAITQDRYGGAETLRRREVATPVPNSRQVLVRVAAAGVDRGAYHLMRGMPYIVRLGYGLRAPRSHIPGTNIAGTVETVGDEVTDLKAGDLVYGACSGAFAEYAVADPDRLAPKPSTLSFEEAAVLPYAGAVSLQAIREKACIEAGSSVLIVGASGAVGTVAVQIAKAFGADVTGVSSRASADLVRGLGADHVIDYMNADFPGRGDRYDVILDIGGNTPLSQLREALDPRGTLVIIGGEDGGRFFGGTHRQVGALLLAPFVRQRLGTLIASEGGDVLQSLNGLVEAGLVRPVMGRCAPLGDAADAITDLDHHRTRGRIALIP